MVKINNNLKNIICLAGIQGANATIPLVLAPFVYKAIGAEAFGKVIVSESIAAIAAIGVIYSFDIETLGWVAGKRSNESNFISATLCNVICARLFLSFVCFILIISAQILVDRSGIVNAIAWSMVPLSVAIQPTWIFQAFTRNVEFAAVNGVAKALTLIISINLIKGPNDVAKYPIIIGLCSLIGACMGLWIAIRTFGIHFVAVRWTDVQSMIRGGFPIMVANSSTILYRDMYVLILGACAVPSNEVALYALAEKAIKCIQAIGRPLNQHILPAIMQLAAKSKVPSRQLLHSLSINTVPQILFISLTTLVFYLVYQINGPNLMGIRRSEDVDLFNTIILIMAVAISIGPLNYIVGLAGLIALGQKGYYLKAVLITGFTSLTMTALFASTWGVKGAALSFTLSEILLLIIVAARYIERKD